MFAKDRDLLALEPNLFRDVVWAGQRLVRTVSATVSGTTLTLNAPVVDFEQAGVGAGHVATVDGVSYEVVERLSATEATISRLRTSESEPVIPPSPATSRPAHVVTFAPQLAMAHRQVLAMVGIDAEDPGGLGMPTASDITNPEALGRVEVLVALHAILSAASALSGPDSPMGRRAEMYRRWLWEERQRAVARIDLDGDGEPDVARRLNIVQLVRA